MGLQTPYVQVILRRHISNNFFGMECIRTDFYTANGLPYSLKTVKGPLHSSRIWWTLAHKRLRIRPVFDPVSEKVASSSHGGQRRANSSQPNFATSSEVSHVWRCIVQNLRFLTLKRGAQKVLIFGWWFYDDLWANIFGMNAACI